MDKENQTADVKETTAPTKEAATDKKEPLDVVKWSGIDPISGQKVQKETPVYSIEEYRELASKGLAADSKWQAIPTLVKQQASELAKELAESELEPRVQKGVEERLAEIQAQSVKLNEDLLNEGDPKEIAKAIKDLDKKLSELSDVVLDDKLERKEVEEIYTTYNAKIGEALTKYPNVKEEQLVPFVRNKLLPRRVDASAIMDLAEMLNSLAQVGIDVENLKPEQREKLEKAFKGKPEEKAPTPGPEGKTTTKEEPKPAPQTFDETLDRIEEFTKKWMEANK